MDGYSFKKTYTLIQQTPIIHFQYDEEGATLRASEVKPKIDRYLCKKCQIKDEWYIDPKKKNDMPALNYKLKIVCEEGVEKINLGFKTEYDIFYGNTSKKDTVSKMGIKSVNDKVKLTVICMIPELMKVIDENIGNFFIVENFGTMQDKGFGNFMLEGTVINADAITKILMDNYQAPACYYFNANDEPFKKVKALYQLMKSGINHGGYQRSLLFLYMHELDQHELKHKIGNEKAWEKKIGLAPIVSKKPYNDNKHDLNKDDFNNSHYVRALLGVSDHTEFLNQLKDRNDKTTITISNPEIQRLESPIYFKIYKVQNGYRIFYVARRINNKIYSKTFDFNSNIKTDNPGKQQLTVPAEGDLPDNFIDNFMDYCFDKLNGSNGTRILDKFDDTRSIQIYRKPQKGGTSKK